VLLAGPRASRTLSRPVAAVISPATAPSKPVMAVISREVPLSHPPPGDEEAGGGGTTVGVGCAVSGCVDGGCTDTVVDSCVVRLGDVSIGAGLARVVELGGVSVEPGTGPPTLREVTTARKMIDSAIKVSPTTIKRRPRRWLVCRRSTDLVPTMR
jgi:hypothetical protein